jgi:hypothetical protein
MITGQKDIALAGIHLAHTRMPEQINGDARNVNTLFRASRN